MSWLSNLTISPISLKLKDHKEGFLDKGNRNIYAPSQDWFAPAIQKSSSVEDSLSFVMTSLKKKLEFIQKLQANLCELSESDFDAVTDLSRQVRVLKTSLELRLGVLDVDRPGAWFRETLNDNAGPFKQTSLKDPVMQKYDPYDVQNVKSQINTCWRQHKILDHTLMASGMCLWRRLLQCNSKFHQIQHVKVGEDLFNLMAVPAELSAEIDSPILRQFLLNVSTKLSQLRTELNSCYSLLWSKCILLWEKQNEDNRTRPYREHARKTRDEFKRKRESRVLSKKDQRRQNALSFMGFEELPTKEALRAKYLQLAKNYHPDLQGGCEEKFKILSESYRELSGCLI